MLPAVTQQLIVEFAFILHHFPHCFHGDGRHDKDNIRSMASPQAGPPVGGGIEIEPAGEGIRSLESAQCLDTMITAAHDVWRLIYVVKLHEPSSEVARPAHLDSCASAVDATASNPKRPYPTPSCCCPGSAGESFMKGERTEGRETRKGVSVCTCRRQLLAEGGWACLRA